MTGYVLVERLAGSRPLRAAADAALARYARRRVETLDRLDVAGAQRRALLKLVRHARDTRFGREHDFAGVRSVADYQARVPLRTYEAFWADYWGPSFPRLEGSTWPDFVPYFAQSSGTTTGHTKHIPVTREMVRSNRKAALTLTALYLAAHPGTPLLNGRAFFLGGSTDLRALANGSLAGDLSGISAREVSAALRPYTFPPPDLALVADWERKVDLLAERSAGLPVTLVSGVPTWLLTLFDRLRATTGKDRLIDVWPTLRVVVHGGCRFDPYRQTFRDVIGSDRVSLLDTYPSSEGYVATEDPRHGLLRLIPDHGIFFEFVPVGELSADRPTRHTAATVEPGVQYAVVLTTCAGLWSYVLGDTVCFERRDPPLLRFTGRTKYFLSAFGEHLIGEEVERAVAAAAVASGAEVLDFHVGPVFPTRPAEPGRHRYLVEFTRPPTDVGRFAAALDEELKALNSTYRDYRAGGVSLGPPEVVAVPAGGFAAWMASRGKAGGQHKVPRMDGTGQVTAELTAWLGRQGAD
jgi:hypothetical protein